MTSDSVRLYVGNLPTGTTQAQLADLFFARLSLSEKPIAKLSRPRRRGDKPSQPRPIFGFVTLPTDQQAAGLALNDTDFDGHTLKIELSNSSSGPASQQKTVQIAGRKYRTARSKTASPQEAIAANDSKPKQAPASGPVRPADIAELGLKRSAVPLVDIGVNLVKYFKRPAEVIQRAVAANVTKVVVTGVSAKQSRQAVTLCKQFPHELLCTVGVHPHDAKTCDETTISTLRSLATENPGLVCSIGETGLDYNRNFSPPAVQREWFAKQVELACELQLPLFVHEREAHDDLLRILLEHKSKSNLPPVCIHCFTGTEAELRAYVEAGFFIGVTGFICKKQRGQALREMLPIVPLDRLMIETDAPFMGFLKGRFARNNEPCVLPAVVETIAQVLAKPVDVVAQATTNNAKRFFRF